LQRGALQIASVPYGWATQARNWLYDTGWKRTHAAPVSVVSVGNLTLGGTGKTPCVEYIARFFRQRRLRVAVLSRGYGSRSGRNDEAMVLEENLPDVPHLQGADRVALANIAVEELESEVLVLDDGFQHRRLQRNLDVVLIDATNPWGHGYLFPRGLLRESLRNLSRADLVVLTRCDQVSTSERETIRAVCSSWAPSTPVAEARHEPTDLFKSDGTSVPLALRGRPVIAFCGLGNPESFRRTLLDLGANLLAFRTFPDHHAYTRSDVEDLRVWAGQQASDCLVLTTQKDLVKLRLTQLGGREVFALRIRLLVETGKDILDLYLEGVLCAGRP
jgi:tetraacyldisaccharide 4'-kinase